MLTPERLRLSVNRIFTLLACRFAGVAPGSCPSALPEEDAIEARALPLPHHSPAYCGSKLVR
jgi:hypothetical protein